MPAKPRKPGRMSKMPKVPADQQALKTQCEFCDELFPNPTLAVHHLEAAHPNEYQ